MTARDGWLPDGPPGGESDAWRAGAYRWRPHAMPSARNDAIDAAGMAFDVRTVWQRPDPAVAADAIAMWTAHDVIPPDTTAEDRARELVSAAYRGPLLRGVATASFARVDHLMSRFAFVRVFVVPEERRAHLSGVLVSHARAILDRWAEASPGEKVKGVALLLEARELDVRARTLRWENSGAVFAGMLGKTQLRVSFFDHARLDDPAAAS